MVLCSDSVPVFCHQKYFATVLQLGHCFVAVWDDSLVLSFQLPAFSFTSWQGVACLDEDYYYKFGFGME